jgi:DNA polymerase-3 subunit delta
MAKLTRSGEVEAFVRKPDRVFRVILVYGPDSGAVSERARAVSRALVDDPDDPFQLVRMEGDDLASDPERLADEAFTVPLFGGKRVLWVRLGSKNLAPALEPVLKSAEPGDLAPKHAIRAMVEASKHAMALACYLDEARDVSALVNDTFREAGVSAPRDVITLVASLLGSDRLQTRQELQKLVTFAGQGGTLTVEDVEILMADASALAYDNLIDAVFTGQAAQADHALARMLAEGNDAGVMLGFALRHAISLQKSRIALDGGTPMDSVMKSARIFFKRQTAFQKQMRIWTLDALDSAIAQLSDAVVTTRKQNAMADSAASRAMLRIALAARARA